jgi:hypothetical protein
MASAPVKPYTPRNPGPPTADEERIIARILIRHGYRPPAAVGARNAIPARGAW